ncbi:AI-2E family transporter [Thomasclavelia sp.]|uniref:AI-2E family transporter n=1 Tax=Thomasclavelia sp. TaxID=3025757 RepID=UPI0025E3167F|nr:AI-2E family transporter [Thomasclavelia sp.]
MRLFNDDQEMMRYLKSRLIISGFTVTLIFLLFNLGTIYEIISQIIGLFKYLFIGTVIAYILNQPMKLIESQIIKRCKTNSFWYQKKRGLSIFITLILFLCLVITIASIIIPNIIDSLILLMSNISYFVKSVFYNIDRMLLYFKIDFKTTDITSINEFMNMPWQNVVKGVLDFLTKNADGLMVNATNFLSTSGVVFTSFIFSLYLLGNKEKFLRQFRKLIGAIFGYKITKVIFDYAHKTNIVFSNFISGQLVEACILWILYYVTMRLFGFPYPELIATIIALFSFVPFFGPIAAMFVGAFLILSQSAFKAFWFMVYFQVLSQIEDNFIYPRVVGGSVGLPGIWVLLSIFIFGDLFGIFGTVIAVPLAACLYSLTSELVNLVLKKRKLKITETTIEQET